MPHIPHEVLTDILRDPHYRDCARSNDGECRGSISFEEALTFAGKQIKDKWAIVPLCHYHHGIGVWYGAGGLDKRKNEWLALRQATDAELTRYSKAIDYIKRRNYLDTIYGNSSFEV